LRHAKEYLLAGMHAHAYLEREEPSLYAFIERMLVLDFLAEILDRPQLKAVGGEDTEHARLPPV
jgi:hypothetical protein